MATDFVVISRSKTEAIYVTSAGDVVISMPSFKPDSHLPQLTLDLLETLCSKFYFGKLKQKHAIADIMLLNGYLRAADYGDFYSTLESNLREQRATVISCEFPS